MKVMLSVRKHGYLKAIAAFLIMLGLIAGVLGCEGETGTYGLTMAVNLPDGGTATDVTGGSPYAEGDNIEIAAVAADCYRFVRWSVSAGTFGDAHDATTTFTMPAQDVTVTANFELVPSDHYEFYEVDETTAPYIGEVVLLEDQFGTFNATVGYALSFGTFAEDTCNDGATPVADKARHYTLYQLEYGEEEPMLDSWNVTISNQFQDDVALTVTGPVALAVPTEQEDQEASIRLNHFLVYQAYGPARNDEVALSAQLVQDDIDEVYEPYLFANPVQTTVGRIVTEIENPDEYWVGYNVTPEPIEQTVQIANDFGPQILNLVHLLYLTVPTQVIDWGQPLGWFIGHSAWCVSKPPTFPAEVLLEDWITANWLGGPLTANVTAGGYSPYIFANPAANIQNGKYVPIWNWDNHLALYWLEYEETKLMWEVKIYSQLGVTQTLYVEGPYLLAVPTKKGGQDDPVGLDHFLVYVVDDVISDMEGDLVIWDQFVVGYTTLLSPKYFATPVRITYGREITEIKHPDAHLLWYGIEELDYRKESLPIINHFGGQILGVDSAKYLAVPAEKISWDGPWYP